MASICDPALSHSVITGRTPAATSGSAMTPSSVLIRLWRRDVGSAPVGGLRPGDPVEPNGFCLRNAHTIPGRTYQLDQTPTRNIDS